MHSLYRIVVGASQYVLSAVAKVDGQYCISGYIATVYI